MYKKQSQKPDISKNKLQNFLPRHINQTSLTDNIQPNSKVNINSNYEAISTETT